MNISERTELTCPLILMRMGGLDGVALQKREYRYLFNELDINVHAITGRSETEFGPIDPLGHKHKVVPQLDFYHEDSQLLFANQFTEGVEKDGVDEISDEEWHSLFLKHKNEIKNEIDEVLKSIPNNTPILVYNLISLRHAQPAAALAMKELIEKYPNRGFLSHAADPDAERPEKIRRIKKHVLPVLSADPEDKPYSGGPYNMNNLYHIVLNPTQRDNFIYKYQIPEDHVFEIPDFIEFKTSEPDIKKEPEDNFFDYLGKNLVRTKGDSYEYGDENNDSLSKDTVFFLSPVRPVYRKLLKEAMLVAQQYGKSRGVKTAFVVTHPDIDDKQYFQESVEFAEKLQLPYYHLGRDFTLQTLDYAYENFAPLKTVGVVASSAGGWENALNEMAHACIPFFMNNKLNSYKPLTERIGMKTHGTNFTCFTDIISYGETEKIKDQDLSGHSEAKSVFNWIDSALADKSRSEMVTNNYKMAYKYLSRKATTPRLMEAIIYIYSRHGLPGHPGEAVLP